MEVLILEIKAENYVNDKLEEKLHSIIKQMKKKLVRFEPEFSQ